MIAAAMASQNQQPQQNQPQNQATTGTQHYGASALAPTLPPAALNAGASQHKGGPQEMPFPNQLIVLYQIKEAKKSIMYLVIGLKKKTGNRHSSSWRKGMIFGANPTSWHLPRSQRGLQTTLNFVPHVLMSKDLLAPTGTLDSHLNTLMKLLHLFCPCHQMKSDHM